MKQEYELMPRRSGLSPVWSRGLIWCLNIRSSCKFIMKSHLGLPLSSSYSLPSSLPSSLSPSLSLFLSLPLSLPWLGESHPNDEVKLIGHQTMRRNRSSHAGGVCMYIKKWIMFKCQGRSAKRCPAGFMDRITFSKNKTYYCGYLLQNSRKLCGQRMHWDNF